MASLRPIGLIVGIAIASGGCAVRSARVAPASAPVGAPAAWAAQAAGVEQADGTTDLSHWWEQFGDATLTRLVEQALVASPDVRTAQARVRQARAQAGVSKTGLLPSVTAGATGSDGRGRLAAVAPGFDASWEPDLFGAARASVAGAAADLAATVDDLHATQVTLSAEVARTYLQLRVAQERLAILRRNVDAQAQTLELTGFRSQAGLVSEVDVEQARTTVEQTRAQIPPLEATRAQAMHALGVLLGQTPESLTADLSAVAPVPQMPGSVSIGIPADTLRQRPDVHAAEQRVLAEANRLSSTRASRLPRLSLSGSIGSEIVTQAVTGGTSFVASIAGSLVQSIFDGGRIRQQIDVQSAVLDQRLDAYQGTLLTALEDVENALVSLEKHRERLLTLQSAQASAEAAAQLARAQYAAGLTDFQRVLDTQRTVLSVQDSVAATAGDRAAALVQLFKAVGGGWSTAVDTGLEPGRNVQ